MKSTTTTSVRAFTTADYEAALAVNRAAYPDYTESLAEWRHFDETWDHTKYFKSRFVAEEAGRVVGWAQINHSPWTFVPDKYRIDLTVMPEFRRRGHGSALYDEIVALAVRRGAAALQVAAKESNADGIAFLAHRDFVERKRDWESRLFVDRFDFTPFAGADERVAEQGVRITTLAAERDRDPEALRKAYQLYEECGKDVPTIDPPSSRPYEEWLRHTIEAPNALLDGFFIAVDAHGRYLGLSNLFASLDDPTFLWQGLTGVRREARGRGIAMALKLETVRYGKRRGVEHIKTWNDKGNRPMLAINEAMGFEKQPIWITYEKELAS